ncbi:hypothetical protein GWK47_035871 [Chionoecetes opilio]|uniref:Uncharacterized protein n=1 Tax=Chionoecetes opilio TaxID=41210 RepID=A0A8J5CZ81_CHIOP|nr:hypothetical protein GWK47_035871 [Chionoecetes opilio]
MVKIPKNENITTKRALLQEEETPPSPASEPAFTLEPQGEQEPQFVTMQAVEVIEVLNPEEFLPPPPPPSATLSKHETDTEDNGDWSDIPRTDADTSDEEGHHECVRAGRRKPLQVPADVERELGEWLQENIFLYDRSLNEYRNKARKDRSAAVAALAPAPTPVPQASGPSTSTSATTSSASVSASTSSTPPVPSDEAAPLGSLEEAQQTSKKRRQHSHYTHATEHLALEKIFERHDTAMERFLENQLSRRRPSGTGTWSGGGPASQIP